MKTKTKVYCIFISLFLIFSYQSQAQWSYNGNNIFYNNGYVGIGITNPGAPLHVARKVTSDWQYLSRFEISGDQNNIDRTKALSVSNSGTDRFVVYGDGKIITSGGLILFENSGASIIRTQNGPMVFQTDGSNARMSITREGDVGIGTVDPKNKLHVVGQIRADRLNLVYNNAVDWQHALSIKVDNDQAKAFTLSDKNGNEVFRIYGNGIVQSKKIYAEAFQVRPDAFGIYWYDHVFSKEYNLRPLSELEEYITSLQHLPDIPSEYEINQAGYNLVEMDGLLLMKIEELTLYLIQQQKEIEMLKRVVKQIN